jgi:hypothetical protein
MTSNIIEKPDRNVILWFDKTKIAVPFFELICTSK